MNNNSNNGKPTPGVEVSAEEMPSLQSIREAINRDLQAATALLMTVKDDPYIQDMLAERILSHIVSAAPKADQPITPKVSTPPKVQG